MVQPTLEFFFTSIDKHNHILYLCACPQSGACNSVVVVCWCFFLFFVNFLYKIRPLVFSFELFYNCHFGAIYSWAVWALLIVEGRTVTYICLFLFCFFESCLIGNHTTTSFLYKYHTWMHSYFTDQFNSQVHINKQSDKGLRICSMKTFHQQ